MSRSPRPRLIDVAERAGVSRTVASVALRGNGRVSDATRERVRRVAAEMGYTANPIARSLRQQRAGAIGLYLPAELTGHAYYMNFTFGVVDFAKSQGLSVVLISAERDTAVYGRDSVDGYVVIDVLDEDAFVAGLLSGSLPVVSAEATPEAMAAPAGTIAVDHAAAVNDLLDHLWEQGARRPAMMVPPPSSSWSRQVAETYESWCARRRLRPTVVPVPFAPTAEEIAGAVEDIVGASPQPDALVCAQDGSCPGVMAGLGRHGLASGRDILVASYVDSLLMETYSPSITAVDLQPREHGAHCAQMLVDLIGKERDAGPDVAVQPAKLQIRESTRAS